ncbi:MAG: LysM peptidoglycan-binding domain-containing protein, partial [Kiritimatiellae bacterium]|nr:LysM peptidoglycan-binding domain-containing protein [Kiritimatiellia bacterium]
SPKAKKTYASYTGPTKEYVVKNGDTLGAIAYGNGINIRQLKELNGLDKDSIRVGQKLKIPAEKVQKPQSKAAPAPAPSVEKKAEAPVAAPAAATEQPVPAEAGAQPTDAATVNPVAEETAPVVDAPAEAITYRVQEGEDLADVSIRWGVSAAAVRELNNLSEDDVLKPGQILRLPADAQQN